jgi:hypothetical protein
MEEEAGSEYFGVLREMAGRGIRKGQFFPTLRSSSKTTTEVGHDLLG